MEYKYRKKNQPYFSPIFRGKNGLLLFIGFIQSALICTRKMAWKEQINVLGGSHKKIKMLNYANDTRLVKHFLNAVHPFALAKAGTSVKSEVGNVTCGSQRVKAMLFMTHITHQRASD